jgi:NitT/TauT family transport system substrate-binding protein
VSFYVARELYLKDEGIDLEWQLTPGPQTDAALVAGEIDVAVYASSNFLGLVARNLPVFAFACPTQDVTQGVIISNEYAARKGLTRDQPVADRVQALRGATIAASSLTGAPARYFGWLLRKYGLNPETDLNLQAVADIAGQLAAMQNNQVDGLFTAPPIGEQLEVDKKGFFAVWMPRDEPRFHDFVYILAAARKDYIQRNPEAIERVARAIARGNNYVIAHPAGTKTILAKYFEATPRPVIDLLIDTNLKSSFGRDARMTLAQWKNAHDISVESGAIAQPVDFAEGTFWSNQYLKDIPAA